MKQGQETNRTTLALLATGVGAGVMYFLDPDRGKTRRALVRDQLVRAANTTSDAIETTSRDMTNRARGVAELRGWLADEDVSDAVLAERVRARIGSVVGHASSIQVTVEAGRVIVSGPVLADEVDHLLERVRAVRGVKDVENRLEVHSEPGNVPGLQGRPARPRGGEVFELMQESWLPTTRALTSVAGSVLGLLGTRQAGMLGAALAAVGIGLLVRAATSRPPSRVPVPDAGQRALDAGQRAVERVSDRVRRAL